MAVISPLPPVPPTEPSLLPAPFGKYDVGPLALALRERSDEPSTGAAVEDDDDDAPNGRQNLPYLLLWCSTARASPAKAASAAAELAAAADLAKGPLQ